MIEAGVFAPTVKDNLPLPGSALCGAIFLRKIVRMNSAFQYQDSSADDPKARPIDRTASPKAILTPGWAQRRRVMMRDPFLNYFALFMLFFVVVVLFYGIIAIRDILT